MNNHLSQLLSERVALLTEINLKADAGQEASHFATLPDEKNDEQYDAEVDSVLVDFDFDVENQKNFDVYMNIKYFWNDWNPILTDIY